LLAMLVAAWYWTAISRTFLFWAAFILSRPLGAVVGDFLDKPASAGGLEFSRYTATLVLLAAILALVSFSYRTGSRVKASSGGPSS